MILPGNGITISAVRTALGESTNDLGRLCTSNRINDNSFWKPVSSNKVTMNNDNDFYALDDGFNITAYSSPMSLWNAIVNEQDWIYQRPEGTAASRYRLGDYRGYNSEAPAWFDWNFTVTTSAGKGEHRSIENNGSQNLAWIYGNFNKFSWVNRNGQDNAVLGLLMNTAWTGQEYSVYFYRLCSTLDYDSERLNIVIPSDLNTYNCMYKFVPVLTNYMQGNNGDCMYFTVNNWVSGSQWYPLRSNLFGLYLKNEQYHPDPAVTIDLNIDWIDFDKQGYEISNLEGEITYTLSASVNYEVSFGSSIYYDNSASPVSIANIGGTFSPGQTTKTIHFSHKDSFWIAADLKEEDELTFRIQTNYSYLGNSFNFENTYTGYVQ